MISKKLEENGYLVIAGSNNIGFAFRKNRNTSDKYLLELATGRAIYNKYNFDLTSNKVQKYPPIIDMLISNETYSEKELSLLYKTLLYSNLSKSVVKDTNIKFILQKVYHKDRPCGYLCATDKNSYGLSLCNVNDAWNPEIGRALAIGRAYTKPSKYIFELFDNLDITKKIYTCNNNHLCFIDTLNKFHERAMRYFK